MKAPKPEEATQKGKDILQRMAKKDYPTYFAAKKALDSLGFHGKVAFSVFTYMKFGLLKPVVATLGVKAIKKLATSRKAREALIKASQNQINPVAFITAMEALGEEITED